MAVTVSSTQTSRVPGAERYTVTEVTFDNSYADGGEALTPENLNLKRVAFAICTVINGPEAEKFVGSASYNPTTSLIHLHDVKTGKQLAKETDTSKVKVQVVAFGS